jgi:hypothetical protein
MPKSNPAMAICRLRSVGANQVQFDKQRVKKDNELLDLPTTQDKVIGADEVESEENALAKLIEQENARDPMAIVSSVLLTAVSNPAEPRQSHPRAG